MRVSLIIPTIDRPEALNRLLLTLEKQTVLPFEVCIVDQGSLNETELISAHPSLPLILLRSSVASLTKARNMGVSATSGEVVGFLDDDCVVADDYVEKIIDFFSRHDSAQGVQGIIMDFEDGHTAKVGGGAKLYSLYNFFAKIFLLNNSSYKNKLLLSGRNQYASRPANIINCEWLSGVGNYRRKVFAKFSFDETLKGYALGEDKLFSYPIYMDNHSALFTDPSIKLWHKHHPLGRPEGKDWVQMKVANVFYVWKKLLSKRKLAAIAFWWANLGDIISACVASLLGKRPFLFGWWHIIFYIRLLFNKKV